MKINRLFLGTIALCCSSCLMYKDISPKQKDELQKSARASKNMQIPDSWIFDREKSEVSYDWFSELKDAHLEQLISEGLQFNADILIAEEKLNQIELAMQIAGSNLYPSVNAVANTHNNLIKGSHIQNLALKASWELDIWGKNKAANSANTAKYFSAKFQNDKLKQSVAAMVCKAYFLSIAANIQQTKVEYFLQLTRDLEKIYQVRAKVGTSNEIDLSNIKAEIISLEGQLEKINNANKEAKRTLELLTGKYPEGKINTHTDFGKLNAEIPASFPLNLLENRPDILASQYQIESAFYEVQQAKAARLPSVNIGFSAGAAFTNVDALNTLYSNPLVSLGGGLVAPIFNNGALKKNVEIKNSEQRQAVELYAKTMLNALNEVEGAVANATSLEKQIDYGKRAISELEKNIELTKKQIDIGSTDSFTLLQKQRDLLRKEMSLIDLELQSRVERVNLYMALGANGL